jgi:hypothetical protein
MLFADDELGPFLLDCRGNITSLIGVSCDFSNTAAAEEFELSLQCTKLLLQAGADPTSSFWMHELDMDTGEELDIRPFPAVIYCLEYDTLVS